MAENSGAVGVGTRGPQDLLNMSQLFFASVVFLVSIPVSIMVWPMSSRSRWNPSGRVRVFPRTLFPPQPRVADKGIFSIATSLGAQVALALP